MSDRKGLRFIKGKMVSTKADWLESLRETRAAVELAVDDPVEGERWKKVLPVLDSLAGHPTPDLTISSPEDAARARGSLLRWWRKRRRRA